jgi:hypothetical protein
MSTESSESIGFVSWFRARYPGVLIFHIGNERKCSIATGKRLKAEGIVAGIPDYCIPAWSLWIEMKKPGGRLSEAQKNMIEYLTRIGHTVIIGYGARDASEKVLEFCK